MGLSLEQKISICKEVVLAAVAVVGAVVAWRGLGTWSRQLRGGIEFELARRLLKLTYQLREAVDAARSPFMGAAEMVAANGGEAFNANDALALHRVQTLAYQARILAVTSLNIELSGALLEGEVVWGAKIRESYSGLLSCMKNVRHAVQQTITATDPSASEARKRAAEAALQSGPMTIYISIGDAPDPFGERLLGAVEAIESFMRPHLPAVSKGWVEAALSWSLRKVRAGR